MRIAPMRIAPMRIGLSTAVVRIIGPNAPLMTVGEYVLTRRGAVPIAGGLFLITKAITASGWPGTRRS